VLRGALRFLEAATHPGFRVTAENDPGLYGKTPGAVSVDIVLSAAGFSITGKTDEGDDVWMRARPRAAELTDGRLM
jgi:hypothetical protein